MGTLTVGRALAARTGLALFHNHLVVDALAALFPFGSPAIVRLTVPLQALAAELARRDAALPAPALTLEAAALAPEAAAAMIARRLDLPVAAAD